MERQIQTISYDGSRPKHLASILFTAVQRFAFTGGGGRLTTEQIRFGDSGLRISRVRSTGHRIALDENRDVTFLFPRAGSLAIRVAGAEARFAGSDAAFLRPHSRQTLASPSPARGFEGHTLMLPYQDVRSLAEIAGVRPFFGGDFLRLNGPAALRLSDYVAFVLTDLDQPHRALPSGRATLGMAALLRDLIADWLAGVPDQAGLEAGPRRTLDMARVRRAEEIMRGRADQPLSIAEVAHELGVSLRSLQLAFQSACGEGPRSRLTRIRLEIARDRLLAAEPQETVTTIALDSGFSHLSRFAHAYFRAFGERPSETLVGRRRFPAPR